MIVTVMRSAQRYREFVAGLAPHGAGLGEPQMVGGVSGASNQAELRRNEFEMRVCVSLSATEPFRASI
jgi:hypothetical protein